MIAYLVIEIQPMSETNVGANLMFALRTTIVCGPMSEAIVSNSFSIIGLIPVFVRRANIRFDQPDESQKIYYDLPENL